MCVFLFTEARVSDSAVKGSILAFPPPNPKGLRSETCRPLPNHAFLAVPRASLSNLPVPSIPQASERSKGLGLPLPSLLDRFPAPGFPSSVLGRSVALVRF